MLNCRKIKIKFKHGIKLKIAVVKNTLTFFYKGLPFIRVTSDLFLHKVMYFTAFLMPEDTLRIKKIERANSANAGWGFNREFKLMKLLPPINYSRQFDAIINQDYRMTN